MQKTIKLLGIQVMNHNFLDSEEFQGTQRNSLDPFNSKLMTLNQGGGLCTFPSNLALCAPRPRTTLCAQAKTKARTKVTW